MTKAPSWSSTGRSRPPAVLAVSAWFAAEPPALATPRPVRKNRLAMVTERIGMGDSPLERSSLRERIKDVMLQRIVAGVYEPGSRLVETRIAQELRVSQASVREALRDLEHIGCVVYEPYRGCSVRSFSVEELLEAFPVRAALEGLAARLAAQHMTDPELEELRRHYDAMIAAARAGDAHEQSQADTHFHAAIARGARNTTLERQWSFLEPYSRTFVTVSQPGTDLMAVAEQHLPILDALKARDGEQAAAAMDRHLMAAAESLRTHAAPAAT
jgi:DNA-binding GntR family transcriptional regulator